MNCECHDKSHDRPHCGARATARIWVPEARAFFTLCGDCRSGCWADAPTKAADCDNCDARIVLDEDDYLSDDRGIFCERCYAVDEPRRGVA